MRLSQEVIRHNLDLSPASIHLLITSRCNLKCPDCFYGHEDAEISFGTIEKLFREWHRKVRAVAIGGGEPLLHPFIERIIGLGRQSGFYIAITTNGTILKPIRPNRIHISHDSIHTTTRAVVEKAIEYYRDKVERIGVNHIARSLQEVESLKRLAVDTITLLRQKPTSSFHEWDKVREIIRTFPQEVWLDACLVGKCEGVSCMQGLSSMSIDPSLRASLCSNVRHKIPYTNLVDVWREVRVMLCEKRASLSSQ